MEEKYGLTLLSIFSFSFDSRLLRIHWWTFPLWCNAIFSLFVKKEHTLQSSDHLDILTIFRSSYMSLRRWHVHSWDISTKMHNSITIYVAKKFINTLHNSSHAHIVLHFKCKACSCILCFEYLEVQFCESGSLKVCSYVKNIINKMPYKSSVYHNYKSLTRSFNHSQCYEPTRASKYT
jgi:hypothetical protein